MTCSSCGSNISHERFMGSTSNSRTWRTGESILKIVAMLFVRIHNSIRSMDMSTGLKLVGPSSWNHVICFQEHFCRSPKGCDLFVRNFSGGLGRYSPRKKKMLSVQAPQKSVVPRLQEYNLRNDAG
jgi:hypothetical protein